MKKQASVSQTCLLEVLELLDSLGIRYWVDGGWGVDVLIGKQNRAHRDLDINFDGSYTQRLLDALRAAGYKLTTDWLPVRAELRHPSLGFLDVHPLRIAEDGSARQAGLFGKWYDFEAAWFSETQFADRTVPCLTAEAQKLFHTGYKLRAVDRVDMANLERYLSGQ